MSSRHRNLNSRRIRSYYRKNEASRPASRGAEGSWKKEISAAAFDTDVWNMDVCEVSRTDAVSVGGKSS